jgi:hypothetical protein
MDIFHPQENIANSVLSHWLYMVLFEGWTIHQELSNNWTLVQNVDVIEQSSFTKEWIPDIQIWIGDRF